MAKEKEQTYSQTITHLAASSLPPRLTIRVGITIDQTKKLQQELIELCLKPELEIYLTNKQGYKYHDAPLNLTRYLYVLRTFCDAHTMLCRIPNKILARQLYDCCIDHLFGCYGSAEALLPVLRKAKGRLSAPIQDIIAEKGRPSGPIYVIVVMKC